MLALATRGRWPKGEGSRLISGEMCRFDPCSPHGTREVSMQYKQARGIQITGC
jgi:hypothetical protein